MNKITTHHNKIMKLSNILMYRCLLQDDDFNFNTVIEQMQAYIKVKGATQIGPLIQYTKSNVNESNEFKMDIYIMLQCNKYINSVENPYSMESRIRMTNCMYCRFIGPEDKLKFAYDKLNLEAFENDIQLKGYIYTIFVDRNDEENTIIADIFMPRADN